MLTCPLIRILAFILVRIMQTVEQIASLPETKARQCFFGPVVFRLGHGFGSCWDLLTRTVSDPDFFFQVGYIVYQKTFFTWFFPVTFISRGCGFESRVVWRLTLDHVSLESKSADPIRPKTMIWGFGILTRVHVTLSTSFISWISESSLNRFRPTFWIRNPIVKPWKESVSMHQCWLSNKRLLTHLSGANGMALHCVLNEAFGSWLYFFLWEALI